MDPLKRFYEMLKELYHNGFYGEVLVKMENGRIVLIRKTETIKP